MILPPHWTERNEKPETRGTGIVTIYRNGMPWEQFTVKVENSEQLKTDRTAKRPKPVPSRRRGRKPATTAGQIVGEILADMIANIITERTRKRR